MFKNLFFYTNERKSGANMNPYIVFNAFVFEEQ